jgi:hypothetical protein
MPFADICEFLPVDSDLHDVNVMEIGMALGNFRRARAALEAGK